tara:strand:+ start:1871 stop:2389 length:519 start_codon:yes stop_codon:yes gene_type:complete
MEDKQLYISFGSGVRLMAEDVYLNELKALTKRGFRALCKALSVPMVEIGSTRYVEMTTFLLAMRAVTRIGEPTFLAPGCDSIKKNKTKGKATSLDTEKFKENLETVLAELMAAKVITDGTITKEVRTAARVAAERLAETTMRYMPSIEQRKHDEKAIKQAKQNAWKYRIRGE